MGAQRNLLVCLPEPALGPLEPLRAAWARVGVAAEIRIWEGTPPPLSDLVARHDGALDGAMMIGPARRAPSTMLPGPLCRDARGRMVPVSCLPFRKPAEIAAFASAAAQVHDRAADRPAVALLAQWQPQYLKVVDRMRTILRARDTGVFRWSGDALTRDMMLDGLSSGLGLALYVGHGRPVGWVGYHGVRAHHLAALTSPTGAVVSLCCQTASRKRTGLSYAEALPLQGVAGGGFGAICDTLHTDNTRWAVGMCRALLDGAETLGDLVRMAVPQSPAAISGYRIVGDPLIPVRSTSNALRRAQAVRTYE